MLQKLKYLLVWMSRANHCRGFGVQSPADYWFVRNVVNEHMPYYAYDTLGTHDEWLVRRLGLLYFRIANWLQPDAIVTDGYEDYFRAGCKRAVIGSEMHNGTVLTRVVTGADGNPLQFPGLMSDRSVMIVEGIDRHCEQWKEIIADARAVITFDLYYCGIVMFDKKRTKQHYKINF